MYYKVLREHTSEKAHFPRFAGGDSGTLSHVEYRAEQWSAERFCNVSENGSDQRRLAESDSDSDKSLSSTQDRSRTFIHVVRSRVEVIIELGARAIVSQGPQQGDPAAQHFFMLDASHPVLSA